MWICKKCGEKVEDEFDSCWKCSTPKDVVAVDASGSSGGGGDGKKKWRLAFKYFRGTMAIWDELFGEAAQFATQVGPESVAGISHSSDRGNGVVTVWYWTQTDEVTTDADEVETDR
jgi:hypothetical protein